MKTVFAIHDWEYVDGKLHLVMQKYCFWSGGWLNLWMQNPRMRSHECKTCRFETLGYEGSTVFIGKKLYIGRSVQFKLCCSKFSCTANVEVTIVSLVVLVDGPHNMRSKPHNFQVQYFLVELCQHSIGMICCLLSISGMCLV